MDVLIDIAEGKTDQRDVKTLFDDDFLFEMFYAASQLQQQVADLRDRLRIYGGMDKKKAERMLAIFKGLIAKEAFGEHRDKIECRSGNELYECSPELLKKVGHTCIENS